ncbi:MAG: hypothetical protein SGARI_005990 [Bacillariaceae sp.]
MGSPTILFTAITLAVLSALCPTRADVHFADVIPSIGETHEMAVLSRLVYKFRFQQNFTCDNFPEHVDDDTKDLECHWHAGLATLQ